MPILDLPTIVLISLIVSLVQRWRPLAADRFPDISTSAMSGVMGMGPHSDRLKRGQVKRYAVKEVYYSKHIICTTKHID